MEFIVNAVVLSTDRTRSGVRKAKKSFDRLPDQIKFTALLTKDVFQTVATGFRVRMGWGLGRLWRISTNYFSPIKAGEGNRTLVSRHRFEKSMITTAMNIQKRSWTLAHVMTNGQFTQRPPGKIAILVLRLHAPPMGSEFSAQRSRLIMQMPKSSVAE